MLLHTLCKICQQAASRISQAWLLPPLLFGVGLCVRVRVRSTAHASADSMTRHQQHGVPKPHRQTHPDDIQTRGVHLLLLPTDSSARPACAVLLLLWLARKAAWPKCRSAVASNLTAAAAEVRPRLPAVPPCLHATNCCCCCAAAVGTGFRGCQNEAVAALRMHSNVFTADVFIRSLRGLI